MVPGMIVRVGDLGPNNFDDACAGFDEASSQQTTLAKGIATIAVTHLFSFLGEIESFASALDLDFLDTGRYPMLSMPDELTGLLTK